MCDVLVRETGNMFLMLMVKVALVIFEGSALLVLVGFRSNRELLEVYGVTVTLYLVCC